MEECLGCKAGRLGDGGLSPPELAKDWIGGKILGDYIVYNVNVNARDRTGV